MNLNDANLFSGVLGENQIKSERTYEQAYDIWYWRAR